MEKKKFDLITKALESSDSDAEGPLTTIDLGGTIRILDLDSINILENKRNCIVNIKYHPKEDCYSFCIYEGKK